MKKVKFLAMMLAAGMFAACSDALEDSGMDNGEGGNTFDGDRGYVNISLNLPTTSGANTRAESFDDGLAAEYNVNSAIIALFYGANESAAKCKVAFKLTDGDFQMSGSNTDNITSYYASGVRMIPPVNGENVYALAILNPTDNFDVDGTAAEGEDTGDAALRTYLTISGSKFVDGLAELNTAATYSADIASTTTQNNGNFLMTNAPIAKSASFKSTSQPTDADYVMTLAPITVYNEKTLAEGAASDNPIYVERAVAKTTLKVNAATEPKLTVDSEVPAYDEATVTFTGWKLQNTNKSYYPVRKVTDASIPDWDDWKTYFNEGTTDGANEINRFFGETANPYRTYWGIDPNYDKVLSGAELGNNFNILNQGGETSIDWNEVGVNSTVDYSGEFVEYCAENTTKAQAMQDDQLTGVLLKATFTPSGASDGSNFFMRNNTSAIYVETDFIAWATAILANGGTGIPLTDGETLSLKRSASDGTITAPAGTITTSAQVQALLQVNVTNPSTSTKELTEAQANEILTEAGGNIKFYRNGVTYYYTTIIEHFGAVQTPVASTTTISSVTDYVEAKHLGRYGMVRNNWYELQINRVSGPGEPEIPEIPSEPVDETNSYINCEINVLSWAKRQQGVDL